MFGITLLRSSVLCTVLVLGSLVPPQAIGEAREPFVRTFDKSGLSLELKDHIKLPSFWWPRTLLTYPVVFQSPVKASALCLRNAQTGKAEPFQLSEVREEGGMLKSATLNFFSDLPSGAERRFTLAATGGTPVTPEVRQTREGESLVLDAGKLKVRVPASRKFAAGEKVPGPILQLQRFGQWFGDSRLVSPKRAVTALATEVVEAGPLFVTCKLSYQFAGGGSYTALVKAISNYDFVEFSEEMAGLPKEEGAFVENAWTNFPVTNRWRLSSDGGTGKKVDEGIFRSFYGEDPCFMGRPEFEDPAVQFIGGLNPYFNNGWGGMREAAFWNEKDGHAVGLFITDTAKWNDHEYAIWASGVTLSVTYRHANGVLYWKWPLATGTRQTGVASYNDNETPKSGDSADAATASEGEEGDAPAKKMNMMHFAQTRYSDISLNRLKDWVLTYPASAKTGPVMFAQPKSVKSIDDYMAKLSQCSITGLTKGMYHPVWLRDVGGWILPGFNAMQVQMTPEQRAKATAMILLSGYVSNQEEFSPLRNMLGGHPNFMADLKFPLSAASYLFPEHPMAAEWRDQYQKFLDLAGVFFVRPSVPQWEAKGGRFTESIATYNWAFLGPTVESNNLNMKTDGKNRLANPGIAAMGEYLVGILTSPVLVPPGRGQKPPPYVAGVPLIGKNGYKRVHPPQGAHAGPYRGAGSAMYNAGEAMMNFRPLVGEAMKWGAYSEKGSGESEGLGGRDRGTNPHLRSAKFTGYGVVLRAAVDTEEEVSVFLQQIDKGPNYRWGYGNQNGSGDIYYYAAGKSYSGHGFEDAGDGHADDALLTCNTGVYKNWHYYSIGMGELTRPFYNLESAQFAELVPDEGPGRYSYPEYQSRSVMLVGSDYIVNYDAIRGFPGTRFAWNTDNSNEMPFIHPVSGGNVATELRAPGATRSRGVIYYPGKHGKSRMTIVSHKKEVKVIPAKRGKGALPPPYVQVSTPNSIDLIFQDETGIQYSGATASFEGTAGVLRKRSDGTAELSLFHGKAIGNQDLRLTVDDSDLGISASFKTPSEVKGVYFGRKGANLQVEFAAGIPAKAELFVDGARLAAQRSGKILAVSLPAGEHRWEITARQPEPPAPVILRTENVSGGARVLFSPSVGAIKYRVELSKDTGETWAEVGETDKPEYTLKGLPNGTKVHVRVIALNADQQSRPANEYPVYVSDKPLLPPDGLRLALGKDQVKATWGEVLGVKEYRLYRREKGTEKFQEIFRGLQTEFADKAPGIIPAFPYPGAKDNALRDISGVKLYEYAVSAVNGNGEGAKSIVASTDPTLWVNWNPDTELRFKRRTTYWMPPYVHAHEVPPEHYPQ